ncbi:hypothetical protein [Streptomyces sp. NBC_01727]|uniref:hypothetical protein n=1 Tax=unclassified Streptomyces TaxID=2593676 RepID=UPI002E0D9752|nr:hypothetical protein OIE76_01015 [Streptomyces sp. NBC_01727]
MGLSDEASGNGSRASVTRRHPSRPAGPDSHSWTKLPQNLHAPGAELRRAQPIPETDMAVMPPADTLMWEARAQAGRQGDLLAYAEQTAVPTLLSDSSCLDADIYLGGQDRVVLIVHFTGTPPCLPDPPAGVLLRSVHQWPFRRHATHRGPAADTRGVRTAR